MLWGNYCFRARKKQNISLFLQLWNWRVWQRHDRDKETREREDRPRQTINACGDVIQLLWQLIHWLGSSSLLPFYGSIHIICPCLYRFGAVDFACLELKFVEMHFQQSCLSVLMKWRNTFSTSGCVNKGFFLARGTFWATTHPTGVRNSEVRFQNGETLNWTTIGVSGHRLLKKTFSTCKLCVCQQLFVHMY